MRIALLSYSTRPRDEVVHTLRLAEALVAHGERVTVWSLARGGDAGFFRPVDPRVEVRLVPLPDREEPVGDRILRSIDVLAAAFEPASYDVVHAEDCFSANAVTRAGGTCIRTVHHLDTFTTPALAACHERAIVEPTQHVCVSGHVARELRRDWGITATMIPNGVDAVRFESAAGADPAAVVDRETWRAAYAPYVLSVGGVEPRSGMLDLVQAFAAARGLLSSLRLVVAGGDTLFDDPEYRAERDRRFVELGVEPVLLGTVPDADLPGLVAGAAVFAFGSPEQGFGPAPMEALAAGVPVVGATCRCCGRSSRAPRSSPTGCRSSPQESSTPWSGPTPHGPAPAETWPGPHLGRGGVGPPSPLRRGAPRSGRTSRVNRRGLRDDARGHRGVHRRTG